MLESVQKSAQQLNLSLGMTALQNNIWDNKHLQSLVGGFNLRNSSKIRQFPKKGVK